MSDETTPQDSGAMSPASAGSAAGDIVFRLAAWRDERGFPTPGELMDEAAAEIARLRKTAATLMEIAASGADASRRRRMLDAIAMESFADDG